MGLAKETFFLISIMIGLSILIFDKELVDKLKGFFLFILSIVLFLLLLKVIIPAFGTGEYGHWSYTELGRDPIEAIYFIIKNPINTFYLFFSDPIKIQSLKYFIFSGLICSFFFPRYLLIFLPFFAQKYFSDNPSHWGLYFHYNIIIAPLIVITVPLFFYWIQKNISFYKSSVWVFLSLWFIGNILITANLNYIYIPEYLFKNNVLEVRSQKQIGISKLIKNFDVNNIVAVQGNICPHLVGKIKNLYIADKKIIENWTPDFILLDLETRSIWSFGSRDEFLKEIIQIENSGLYKIIQKNNSIILYEKI
jgi:hypothetical protein